eukprot:TRINITY_DN27483_c0_g1_i1.p1 TRINITY_DN27483_c0_g1~~TRINITY_DN27483_c0_g1_i1.p1  ORF type:complete len:130 (+),score=20.03 TRINITY_DN27483_c0_g1_i1:121-510(+)
MAGLELLGRIAAAGAIISFGGAFAFYNYVKTTIKTSNYYQDGIDLVKSSESAMEALAGECHIQEIALAGESRTRLRAHEAQVAIPVHGKDDIEGTVIVKASRQAHDAPWDVTQVRLEIDWPSIVNVKVK